MTGTSHETTEVMTELRALLDRGQEDALEIFLRLIRPEDIADWLDELGSDHRHRILAALDHDAAGTVLADATPAIRSALVENLTPARIARIVEAMPRDEAADLIGDLEDVDGERVLDRVDDADEAILRDLLEYPEDTAGGIMNPDVVALPADATVDDAIQRMRSADPDTITAAAYIVADSGQLLGVVRLRKLVTAHPATRLRDIMVSDVISVPVDADQEDVAEIVDRYDFMAVPVVDRENRLLGAVSVDDVLDVIEAEATEDIYRMAGSSEGELQSESVWHAARYRLPWLLVCLAGTQLSTTVMALFSTRVQLFQQIAIFTPAIMAMGGNTSLQSATITVRRLALDTLPRSRFALHTAREIAVALLMGAVCGVAETVVALLLGHDPNIGVAVGAAMAIGMSAASLLGAAMPLVLDGCGVDPAVASGPLVSTINDSLGLTIYFTVATFALLFLG